jgi:hypothetical protein
MEGSGQLHHFTLRETDPSTHCIGGWVGLRSGLDVMEKRKISSPLGIESQLSSPKQVTIPTELSQLPTKGTVERLNEGRYAKEGGE